MKHPGTTLDLLEERRQELGLGPPRHQHQRLLVWRGAAVAAVMLAGVVATGLLITLWATAGHQRLAGLGEAAHDHDRLAARLRATEEQTAQLERGTTGLVEALVNVRSSSALLSELVLLTPGDVQLKTLGVVQDAVTLEGEAASWQAVNLLQLRLQSSPFFRSGNEVPVNQVPVKGTAKDRVASPEAAYPGGGAVKFQLKATFAADAVAQVRPVLEDLGALGMTQRVRLLEANGLLAPIDDEG